MKNGGKQMQPQPPITGVVKSLTHKDLPCEDGTVNNMHLVPQAQILNECMRPFLIQRHAGEPFCIAADSAIYYHPEGCKAPDWFYVPGVGQLLEGEFRRSYVLWEESIAPMLVAEFVSGDGSEERDTTPGSGKFWVYERYIRATYYVIFDVYRQTVEAWELANHRYRPIHRNNFGRIPLDMVGVELGLWHGTFEQCTQCWLRPWDSISGLLLPNKEELLAFERQALTLERQQTDKERLEKEKERREKEKERREKEKERREKEKERREKDILAAKLRELGLDPASLLQGPSA
jgi:hypothetical protein